MPRPPKGGGQQNPFASPYGQPPQPRWPKNPPRGVIPDSPRKDRKEK